MTPHAQQVAKEFIDDLTRKWLEEPVPFPFPVFREAMERGLSQCLSAFAAQQVKQTVDKSNAANGHLGMKLKRLESLMAEASDWLQEDREGTRCFSSPYQRAAFVTGVRQAEARVWEAALGYARKVCSSQFDLGLIEREFRRRAQAAPDGC